MDNSLIAIILLICGFLVIAWKFPRVIFKIRAPVDQAELEGKIGLASSTTSNGKSPADAPTKIEASGDGAVADGGSVDAATITTHPTKPEK